MDYEQASIIGKRRRADAAMLLSGHVRERVGEFCAVKPAKNQGLDARDWEPVGEQNFKEINIRTGLGGDKEAYLLIVDQDGATKACTQRTYPLPIALQMAWAFPLPTYAGGALLALAQEEAQRRAQSKAQQVAQVLAVWAWPRTRPVQRAGPSCFRARMKSPNE